MKKLLTKLKKDKKGFTLIEMIVVIVIIAILAAIAVPAVMSYIDDARDAKLQAQGHSAMTTVQAELAKAQATSADGKFTPDHKVAATKKATDSNTAVTAVEVCSQLVSEATPECTDEAVKGDVSKIQSFVVTIGSKKVFIPINGASTPFIQDVVKP